MQAIVAFSLHSPAKAEGDPRSSCKVCWQGKEPLLKEPKCWLFSSLYNIMGCIRLGRSQSACKWQRTAAQHEFQIRFDYLVGDSNTLSERIQTSTSSDGVSADAGFNYNIVAIFGSQSTGGECITFLLLRIHCLQCRIGMLLNGLSGTTFDVMDETRQQQMTKDRFLDLYATITSSLSPLFLGQHQNLHKSCLLAFKSILHATLSGDGTSYNFGKDKTKKLVNSSLFAPDRLDVDRDEDERRRVWNNTVREVVDLALRSNTPSTLPAPSVPPLTLPGIEDHTAKAYYKEQLVADGPG
ncbi:hypothetical protein HD554DRAFT_2041926 [Boletus coccyginus]|nr:hypothetical protein HD554DRAFT_2041926 [Boletus coccyginus]